MNRLKEQREQYRAYRKTFYKDYPQVEKFEKTKKALLMALFLLFLSATAISAYMQSRLLTSPGPFFYIAAFVMKMDWVFLLASMTPKWRINTALYLLGFYHIMTTVSSLAEQGIFSFGGFLTLYANAWRAYPPAAAGTTLLMIYIVMLFLTATWLVFIPKNRELARQSEELNEKWKNSLAANFPVK